jgi:hypothetical protein
MDIISSGRSSSGVLRFVLLCVGWLVCVTDEAREMNVCWYGCILAALSASDAKNSGGGDRSNADAVLSLFLTVYSYEASCTCVSLPFFEDRSFLLTYLVATVLGCRISDVPW